MEQNQRSEFEGDRVQSPSNLISFPHTQHTFAKFNSVIFVVAKTHIQMYRTEFVPWAQKMIFNEYMKIPEIRYWVSESYLETETAESSRHDILMTQSFIFAVDTYYRAYSSKKREKLPIVFGEEDFKRFFSIRPIFNLMPNDFF
jgi:hypothetical protein